MLIYPYKQKDAGNREVFEHLAVCRSVTRSTPFHHRISPYPQVVLYIILLE